MVARKGILRSGLVRASGYANKIRRVSFATFKNAIDKEEIVRAAAELNMKLFDTIREHNIQKNYIIRIEVPYRITTDNKIEWDYSGIKIEVFVPTVIIEGGEVRLVEAAESERFEKTYEEYEAEHGDEEEP